MNGILALIVACTGSDPADDRSPEAPPVRDDRVVVLVSWDTTRADALSCYGTDGHTPIADGLAATGVRFDMALAHAPTTLNSHASILSGLDPHGHKVVRNGYPVPEDIPWLPALFEEHGWDTLGVAGGSVLDASMGMARGFRIYDGIPLEERRYEDPADLVVERALRTVDRRLPDRPVFLFVHFYDPHNPYNSAPARIRNKRTVPAEIDGSNESIARAVAKVAAGDRAAADPIRQRYLSEVEWVDEQLGSLLTGLRERGLDQNQLLVLLSDHGESMAEPQTTPFTHGPDIDLAVTRVPLILRGTGSFALPPTVVQNRVSLKDVAPTIAELAALPADVGTGRPLRPLWTGGNPPIRLHFAEATKPGEHEAKDRWNNLPFERGVASHSALLVRTPSQATDELFGLKPHQPPLDNDERKRALGEVLTAWDAKAPPWRGAAVDPAMVEKLRALGYVE